MIKNKKIKIIDIKWNNNLLLSESCLRVLAKYKHPIIVKNIEIIWERWNYQMCKELMLNYAIGEDGKIDSSRKKKLVSKYPSELLERIFREY
jgi:hypothetical protein